MPGQSQVADAIVIGAGFFGCQIAIYLNKERGFQNVTLIEQGPEIFGRASTINQARVHGGYHYPRSALTASSSRKNMGSFIAQYDQAICSTFSHLYPIAASQSKITSNQFKAFARRLSLPLAPASTEQKELFDLRLIEDVCVVDEYAFDAHILREITSQQLEHTGCDVRLHTTAGAIREAPGQRLVVEVQAASGVQEELECTYVFNCTYSGINTLQGELSKPGIALQHEIAEVTLITPPEALNGLAVTLIDGPFFSTMPFPLRDCYSLTHVRYTPHFRWECEEGKNPYHLLSQYEKESRSSLMLKDASRYLPAMRDASYVDALFEIKTTLPDNKENDGRPILFRQHRKAPGYFTVMGGKIDNIYDILEKLESIDL